MKILAQNYSSGRLEMLEVPMFTAIKGLLVETRASVVSVGTETTMIDMAKKSLLGKALARPDWVKQVVDKIKTEGLPEAWRQSKARLDTPVPLGYSCAGIIKDVCEAETGFRHGDRVACSGSGFASHAEWNVVPPNLCTKIPDNVSFEDASYVALGGIAMEAIRLARTEFGYRVGVIGLGLLGQLAVQILKAAGCHVFGVDISFQKCELALLHGAEVVATIGKDEPVALSQEFSGQEGLDAVIIFASVDSNEPLIQAAGMCRERGRIVAGGLVGLDIPREVFYRKEIDLAVSRAWGPGMYDPDYEERNVKYPLPYVRWTAQRNMEEFLKMVSLGSVTLNNITTHISSFEKALDVYEMILTGKQRAIGVVLQYNDKADDGAQIHSIKQALPAAKPREKIKEEIRIGLIGAGLFARGTLLPAMGKANGIKFRGVATSRGLTGEDISRKYGFDYSTTDYKELLADPKIDLVFVLTRHNSHSKFVCESLAAGKAVFVEKPLCTIEEQLREIVYTYYTLTHKQSPFVMVGFNRRFATATRRCIDFVGRNGKSSVVQIRCNSGYIPPESWVHKSDEGGGRIIGEVCHFVDLAEAITAGLPRRVFAACTDSPYGLRDNLTISMQMDNGAAVSIVYASNGDKSFPREEVQVFAGGRVCVIDNFKNVRFITAGKKKEKKALETDRGHVAEISELFGALKNGKPSPLNFESIIATTLATFAIEESITTGKAVEVDLDKWRKN